MRERLERFSASDVLRERLASSSTRLATKARSASESVEPFRRGGIVTIGVPCASGAGRGVGRCWKWKREPTLPCGIATPPCGRAWSASRLKTSACGRVGLTGHEPPAEPSTPAHVAASARSELSLPWPCATIPISCEPSPWVARLDARCRLFWNHTCTCRGVTLNCAASAARVAVSGVFSTV
eukprot:7379216-Prymnesium_polylepis.1